MVGNDSNIIRPKKQPLNGLLLHKASNYHKNEKPASHLDWRALFYSKKYLSHLRGGNEGEARRNLLYT